MVFYLYLLNNNKALRQLICLLLLLLLSFSLNSAEDISAINKPILIKYAKTDYEYFRYRDEYFIKLISLAMEKANEAYDLVPVYLTPTSASRSRHYLQSGIYTIHWLNTSKQLEDELLAIRIPLFKGLIGWRLLLIRESKVKEFSKLDSADTLKKFTILQGDDWPDTRIFDRNGFKTVTSTDFATLSKMLWRGRGDVFPRSVTEVWEELKSYKGMGVTVEDHLALHYPAAYYFFVTKYNLRLKKAMEKGLNMAIKDGSFDRLFFEYYSDIIERARLDKRTVISLNNPFLSENTPIEREELWLQPGAIPAPQ